MGDAVKKANKKRSSAKSRFHRIYNGLNLHIQKGEEIEVLSHLLSDLESAYKNLEEKHEDYIDQLDSEDDYDKIARVSASEDMDKNYEEVC